MEHLWLAPLVMNPAHHGRFSSPQGREVRRRSRVARAPSADGDFFEGSPEGARTHATIRACFCARYLTHCSWCSGFGQISRCSMRRSRCRLLPPAANALQLQDERKRERQKILACRAFVPESVILACWQGPESRWGDQVGLGTCGIVTIRLIPLGMLMVCSPPPRHDLNGTQHCHTLLPP